MGFIVDSLPICSHGWSWTKAKSGARRETKVSLIDGRYTIICDIATTSDGHISRKPIQESELDTGSSSFCMEPKLHSQHSSTEVKHLPLMWCFAWFMCHTMINIRSFLYLPFYHSFMMKSSKFLFIILRYIMYHH